MVDMREPNVSKQLEIFMTKYWPYISKFDRNTRLQQDMGLTGDDAAEILIAFGREFNVNVNAFPIDEYFKAEGFSFNNILTFLRIKKTKDYKCSQLDSSKKQFLLVG